MRYLRAEAWPWKSGYDPLEGVRRVSPTKLAWQAGPESAITAAESKRLAVVISHPIQHFAPLFRLLASEPGIELKVFYCCDWGVESYQDPGFGQTFKWDIPLLEGYEYEFLPIARRPTDLGFFSIDNPAVAARLNDFDADAVWIHGYSHRSSWRAYFWALRKRRRILYFGDSELLAKRGALAKALKYLVLPAFFSRCDAFLTIGDNNENYYRHYSVPKCKFFRGSFPVDISRFQQALSMSEAERASERGKLGLQPNALVALFVGKFIDIKRPLDLVQTAHRLKEEIPQLQILMLGSGPLEPLIRQEITRLGLEGRVLLPGFINQKAMPEALALGDFLIMSSEVDPHPLAVTEAMAVGNAIIASNRVGCVGPSDAARVGENTLVYPCGDIDALCACVADFASKREKLKQFQQRSIALSLAQDIAVMASAVTRALAADSRELPA